MGYCYAKYNDRALDKAYRIYVTDSLKAIAENTSKYAGGSYMRVRFAEILNPKPEETRTPEDIISGIKEKLAEIREAEN